MLNHLQLLFRFAAAPEFLNESTQEFLHPFSDETKAKLLKMHCHNIECSIANSAQMMVRSLADPGSSRVTEQLLSTLNGATLYSFLVPELEQGIKVINHPLRFGSDYLKNKTSRA